MLGACTERTICPAYQSAFLHDPKALTAHFSYFNQDSTPKLRDVSKSRYLVVEPVAYKKRIRELRTITMQDVYPVPDDSVGFDQDLMLAERDVLDSTQLAATDSIHPGLKGPFNIDQQLYMYYLEDVLLLPDVRAQMDLKYERKKKKGKKNKKEVKEESTEEKEKTGPFSIFKKKNKKEEEEGSEDEESPDDDNEEEEDDF